MDSDPRYSVCGAIQELVVLLHKMEKSVREDGILPSHLEVLDQVKLASEEIHEGVAEYLKAQVV